MPLDLGVLPFEAVSNLGADLSAGLPSIPSFTVGSQGVGNFVMPGLVESTGGGLGATEGGFFTGLGNTLSKIGTGIGTYAEPAAKVLGGLGLAAQVPLGLMSLNIARQGQKALQQGVQTEEALARPAIAAETALLPAGTEALMTGQLPPELQTQVNMQVNQTEQAMLQQLEAQGINPDTARAMITGQIEQLRNQLTLQAAQSLLSGGGSAGTLGQQTGLVGGNLGTTEYQTATGALTGANQALMQLMAAQGQ